MKHKHYECIVAWAEGKQIQIRETGGIWEDIDNPSWINGCQYRIKPERQQWHQDLIDAVKAGKVVEYNFYFAGDGWGPSLFNQDPENYDFGNATQDNYRVRPEPKPDICRYLSVRLGYTGVQTSSPGGSVKLTYDGETGELKSAEVIK